MTSFTKPRVPLREIGVTNVPGRRSENRAGRERRTAQIVEASEFQMSTGVHAHAESRRESLLLSPLYFFLTDTRGIRMSYLCERVIVPWQTGSLRNRVHRLDYRLEAAAGCQSRLAVKEL